MGNVNLFHYATRELSQDAFLAWLLAWASPDNDGPMHDYGIAFLKYLYNICKADLPYIASLAISQQQDYIDVQCRINGEEVLLIEDKVGTQQHSEQLSRYKDTLVQQGFAKIHPVYIQTGDQCDYSSVLNDGYAVVTRKDLLGFFHDHAELQAQLKNQILDDYVEYMTEIEANVQSYLSLPISEWHGGSWTGFYQALQERLEDGKWGYVPNPSGGFMGFWWNFLHKGDIDQYLQLEQDRLCFKIWGNTATDCRAVMYQYREHFIREGQKNSIDIISPNRLRAGVYTTVAVLAGDYRICNSDGIIDMDATVQKLKQMTAFQDSAMAVMNQQ